MANTLFLRLEAPLQAWGMDSQWSYRRTALEPTKSGVVGLLACALGWGGDEPIRELARRVQIGVRCDFPGAPAPLEDYHTVGGGYATPQLLTAAGKLKYSSGRAHTEQTWRYYLCDASFLVAVQSGTETISQLAAAVQAPTWPLFLGRKACVPSRPIFDGTGEFATLAEALEKHPVRLLERERGERRESRPRMVIEWAAGETRQGAVRRRDQTVARSRRLFEPRYARETRAGRETVVEYLDDGGE